MLTAQPILHAFYVFMAELTGQYLIYVEQARLLPVSLLYQDDDVSHVNEKLGIVLLLLILLGGIEGLLLDWLN